jgi:hypothetical protein
MIAQFKKDQYGLGIFIGIILPVISFVMVYLFNLALISAGIVSYFLELKSHFLVSMVINVIPIRYYFVNLKYDKTGRGLLLITFLLVMLFFALNDWITSLANSL